MDVSGFYLQQDTRADLADSTGNPLVPFVFRWDTDAGDGVPPIANPTVVWVFETRC